MTDEQADALHVLVTEMCKLLPEIDQEDDGIYDAISEALTSFGVQTRLVDE